MKIYALIIDGRVHELIRTNQDIKDLYHPDFVSRMVEVTESDPAPDQGWLYVSDGENYNFVDPEIEIIPEVEE